MQSTQKRLLNVNQFQLYKTKTHLNNTESLTQQPQQHSWEKNILTYTANFTSYVDG